MGWWGKIRLAIWILQDSVHRNQLTIGVSDFTHRLCGAIASHALLQVFWQDYHVRAEVDDVIRPISLTSEGVQAKNGL